ncbi:MAG: glycosyltransferase [Phycisphaerae bacterium]|jgi:biofilm PGA synthesis N-glycosyltransferase PgaC
MSNDGGSNLTVLVPAYNEAATIADTIRSLQAQTLRPDEIIVIDDCSTDNTADIARSFGVTVLRPPQNTGCKAGAQNFAMDHVKTQFTMAIDADTMLAPDAIATLLAAFQNPSIAAACGLVLPRYVKTVWERGRYIEYLFAFSFYKRIQDYYERPLISSGCFSAYRTDILRAVGCWSTRTLAEDMDLTWSFYQAGHGVRFIPQAVCYPVEPHNWNFMRKQLKRWSHGFVQNVRLHWRRVLEIPFLRSLVAVALWDAVLASLAYLVALPLLAIFVNPLFLLGYVLDLPAVAFPVLLMAAKRKEILQAVSSLPGFFVMRAVNSMFILEAVWSEWIVRRPLKVYEKGH